MDTEPPACRPSRRDRQAPRRAPVVRAGIPLASSRPRAFVDDLDSLREPWREADSHVAARSVPDDVRNPFANGPANFASTVVARMPLDVAVLSIPAAASAARALASAELKAEPVSVDRVTHPAGIAATR